MTTVTGTALASTVVDEEAEALKQARLVILRRIAEDCQPEQDVLDLAHAYKALCEPTLWWWWRSGEFTWHNRDSG